MEYSLSDDFAILRYEVHSYHM